MLERYRTVIADLHSHNWGSPDSPASPIDVVERCRLTGVTLLAVTNHNTLDGVQETQDAAKTKACNLVIIPAEEITSNLLNPAGKKVELLAYFPKEAISPNLSPEQILQEIKKQDGMVAILHPYELWRHGAGKEIGDYIVGRSLELGIPTIWETYNSRSKPENNRMSFSYFQASSNRGVLYASAGSDAHHPREMGRCKLVLAPWDWENQQELKDGLLNRLRNSSPLMDERGYSSQYMTLFYRVLTRFSNLKMKINRGK